MYKYFLYHTLIFQIRNSANPLRKAMSKKMISSNNAKTPQKGRLRIIGWNLQLKKKLQRDEPIKTKYVYYWKCNPTQYQ